MLQVNRGGPDVSNNSSGYVHHRERTHQPNYKEVDLEDTSDESEESEWSENIDVDIGWWNRQRRRRTRRQPNVGGSQPLDSQSNHQSCVDTDGDNNEMESNLVQCNDSNRTFSLTGRRCNLRSMDRRNQSRRCSLRQRKRLQAKRKLLQEAKLAKAEAAKKRLKNHHRSLRRSLRFNRSKEDNTKFEKDLTNDDDNLSPEPAIKSDLAVMKADDLSFEELLKRRLIISMDYAFAVSLNLVCNTI